MAKKLQQDCLTLYPETEKIIERLNNEQVGRLIRALVQYRYHGTEAEITDDVMVGLAYDFMSCQVDRMEQVKQRNAAAANSRWEKQKNQTATDPVTLNACEEAEKNFPF